MPSRASACRSSRGERLGLVGESGCGKSTTMLALMGLLPPNASVAGQRAADGVDILAGGEETVRPHRWVDLAMVFQGAMNALNPVQTVGSPDRRGARAARLAAGAAGGATGGSCSSSSGFPRDARRPLPARVLGRDAPARGDRDGAGLQAERPLADEPTTALDVMVQAQILELLERSAASSGSRCCS